MALLDTLLDSETKTKLDKDLDVVKKALIAMAIATCLTTILTFLIWKR
jgi:hypothetical protein